MIDRNDTGNHSIERREVRRAFGRAAATYDAAAELQRRVREELLSRLDYVKLEPTAVLDLGAGTGHATLALPLNAIMGFSEVMKDQHLGPMTNPRYLGYAGDIHASGSYLLGIINDILDLSKIEAGKMSLEAAEDFPLRQALEAALGITAPLSEKSGVTLAADLPDDSVHVLAVERMVRQIIINLVGNAIKFTPRGGSVMVRGAMLAGGAYTLRVSDTGVGMTEADIAHALQPFGQVENRMAATHNGTGLGLPLAKAMMELHGGTLVISSAPNEGTSVLLTFPAIRVSTTAMTGRNAAA